MSIREYVKDGKVFYEVYINKRDKKNPSKRFQARKRGFKSKSQAQGALQLLLEKAILDINSREKESKSWGKLVFKWYEYKRVDTFEPISAETLEDYYRALQTWTAPFWGNSYTLLTRSEIKNLLQRMENQGKSKSYQAKMKHIINCVFNWGINEGEVTELRQSPALGIKVNRKSEKQPLILNVQEIRRLLDAAEFYSSPWKPIWSLALMTGCRNGELFALTWDDVDFTTDSIRITKSFNKRTRTTKGTKGGYWRTVPMNSELKSVLMELKTHSKTNEVLPRLRDWCQGNQAKALRAFCVSIGITPISFHALRACFATQLLQNNVPAATVMKICGWKDLDVMTRYIRLAGIDESGATNALRFITPKEATDKVIGIFRKIE